MSDPRLSDIDCKNKMALVWTTVVQLPLIAYQTPNEITPVIDKVPNTADKCFTRHKPAVSMNLIVFTVTMSPAGEMSENWIVSLVPLKFFLETFDFIETSWLLKFRFYSNALQARFKLDSFI